MKIINENDLNSKKNSDTIVIYGCGYSINNLTDEHKKTFSQFDSIAYNWFVKSKISTTFYFIREQAVAPSLISQDENPKILVQNLKDYYSNSTLIISDLRTSSDKWNKAFNYATSDLLNLINNEGIICKEFVDRNLLNGNLQKVFDYNIFRDGVIWDFCTFSSIMHIVSYLKYKRIILAGFDLYDHRYFWKDFNKTREITERKGRKVEDRHYVSNYIIKFLQNYKQISETELFVVNEYSLLSSVINIWKK